MADSLRLTVLKRLTALIAATELTPYAGTLSGPLLPATLANLVFRGRTLLGADMPDTMVSILESPNPDQARFTADGAVRKSIWPLLITGYCPEDKRNPTDPIYSMVDDIERQLDRIVATNSSSGDAKYPEHYLLGADLNANGYLINAFQAQPAIVRPPTDQVSSKTFFWMPVQVELARFSD